MFRNVDFHTPFFHIIQIRSLCLKSCEKLFSIIFFSIPCNCEEGSNPLISKDLFKLCIFNIFHPNLLSSIEISISIFSLFTIFLRLSYSSSIL